MNHAFVTIKGSLSAAKIDAALREINARRFKGIFLVTRESDVWWEIRHPVDGNWRFSLTVAIDTRRKLHTRKAHGYFGSWMQNVFQEELAQALNGRCSDEGIPDRWDPDPQKYPTFRAYWAALHEGMSDTPESAALFERVFQREVADWPEDLKPFA